MKKIVRHLMLVSFFCMIVQSRAIVGKKYYCFKVKGYKNQPNEREEKQEPSDVGILWPSNTDNTVTHLVNFWNLKSSSDKKETIELSYYKMGSQFYKRTVEPAMLENIEKQTKLSNLENIQALTQRGGIEALNKDSPNIPIYKMKKENDIWWKADLISGPKKTKKSPKSKHKNKKSTSSTFLPKMVSDNVHWILISVILILLVKHHLSSTKKEIRKKVKKVKKVKRKKKKKKGSSLKGRK